MVNFSDWLFRVEQMGLSSEKSHEAALSRQILTLPVIFGSVIRKMFGVSSDVRLAARLPPAALSNARLHRPVRMKFVRAL
jgi:predicted nucleotidyltransferase